MTETRSVSIPDDQAEFVDEEGYSLSSLLQDKIAEKQEKLSRKVTTA